VTADQLVEVAKVTVSLVQALVWPVVILFVLYLLRRPLSRLIGNAGELNLNAFGVQATIKREHVEAAALLGAAEARRSDSATSDGTPPDENSIRRIADTISEAAAQTDSRQRSRALVLWVDDNPGNNLYERKSLEAFGIHITVSTSTEDALEKVRQTKFDAIISDMGRPPDPRAGYTLLDKLRTLNIDTPFIIYAGSNALEHKAEARRHGALGSTNDPQELFQLVTNAVFVSTLQQRLA
jgi:CheY-like chemotaxis protein